MQLTLGALLALAAGFGAAKVSHLRRAAQYPNVASAIAAAPVMASVIPDVLTCPALEAEVTKTCGKVPVFMALKQFAGNEQECESAHAYCAVRGGAHAVPRARGHLRVRGRSVAAQLAGLRQLRGVPPLH